MAYFGLTLTAHITKLQPVSVHNDFASLDDRGCSLVSIAENIASSGVAIKVG